jgi:hypothetical protein
MSRSCDWASFICFSRYFAWMLHVASNNGAPRKSTYLLCEICEVVRKLLLLRLQLLLHGRTRHLHEPVKDQSLYVV